MSLEEIQVVIQTHQEWLNSKGVSGLQANFKGMDLDGYDLRQQDLSGADFTEANLQRANLERANPVSYTHLTLPTILRV